MLSGLSPLAVAVRRGIVVPDWVTRASSGTVAKTDADFTNNRYWFKDAAYYNEAAWLEVIGGSKSGITRTIGPFVDPSNTNILTNGTFDTATTGWAAGGTGASIAHVDLGGGQGEVQLTAGGSLNCVSQQVSGKANRAFKMTGTGRRGTTANDLIMVQGFNAAMSSFPRTMDTTITSTSPSTRTGYVTFSASPMYVGFRNTNGSGTGTALFDDISLVEVWPFQGFTQNSVSVAITATAPAAAASDEVLWQADCNDEQYRIRVLRQSADDKVLVIVTAENSASASLDLGAVTDGAQFSVAFTATQNSFSASLNGGTAVTDSSGGMPGLAIMRIGRSFTGNTWTGTIERVTVL